MDVNSTNINKTTYDVGNPSPSPGQVQKCGGVKPVNLNEKLPSS